MKTYLACMSVLMLALTAMALPLTDASDKTKRDVRQGTPDGEPGTIRVAQARPKKEAPLKRKAAKSRASVREATAKNSSAAKSKRIVPITAEMEAEVGKFVGKHHRDLLEVLAHLKDNVPQEYERAVRDLNRNRLRLQQLEGRDRYAVELELWKAQSRARLLGARVQMGDGNGVRDALRETLAEIHELRASIVQRERNRLAERLKKLDEQLEALHNDRDENLEKQMLALTKTTSKRNKPVTTSARNAKPTPGKRTSGKRTPAKKTPPKKTPPKKSSTQTID